MQSRTIRVIGILLTIVLLFSVIPMASAANSVSASIIVGNARTLIDQYPYVWGGESPEEGGFDCSGLVWYVYNRMCGINISLSQAGRKKAALASAGTKITGISNFLPGDILQFNSSHVAIYIGNSSIIEAPQTGYNVRSRKIKDSEIAYAIRLSSVTQAEPAAPTSATISIDHDEVLASDVFTMTLKADQPCLFYLAILDADSGERIMENHVASTGIYKNSFLRCGHYNAYMSAYNASGTVDSNWIDFWVYGTDAPTTAKLSVSASSVKLGESVTFTSWMDAYYAKYYISIYDDATNELVDSGWKPINYTFTPPKAGTYNATMSAYTKAGTAHSNWVSFQVLEKHVLTEHKAVKATCTKAGTEAYWECSDCHKLFSDADGKVEIEKPIEIPLISHSLTGHKKVDATVKKAGSEAYWECSVCHKLFEDAEGMKEIGSIPVIPKVMLGDLTGDGILDGRDTIRLMKYLAGELDEAETKAIRAGGSADINQDGKINELDLLRLMKYFAGEINAL